MVLIALTGLFILRFGPRPRYVGFAMLVAVYGIYMGVRHSALHVARDIGQGFSAEILGAHTNTWSMLIFWCAAVAMGLLLMTIGDGKVTRVSRTPTRFETGVMWLFLVVVGANAVQAFASTGPPPFTGQSDPVRFSFDPRRWVWSLEEWAPAPVSLRGRWAIPRPDTSGLSHDPDAGPFAGLMSIAPTRTISLPPLGGEVTGLAFDAATDRFLATTVHGIHVLDAALGRVEKQTIVDPGYSVDLARFGGGTFLDSRTVLALSENKSFVVLRENDRPDADANFRFFLAPGPFDEVTRGRFATVRAKMHFVRAVAFDPGANAVYTITVPTPRASRLVVSQFDRGDLTLSREFLAVADGATGPGLRTGRSLDELYVTAATVRKGLLHGLSAAYATVIAIDPASGRVVSAFGLQGVRRPAGLAVRASELYVAAEDGSVHVFPLPEGLQEDTRPAAAPE
jgi:disulfide bond formation protein DsbB